MSREIDRRLATLESRSVAPKAYDPTPEQWASISDEERTFLEATLSRQGAEGRFADVLKTLDMEDLRRLTSILRRLQPESIGVD